AAILTSPWRDPAPFGHTLALRYHNTGTGVDGERDQRGHGNSLAARASCRSVLGLPAARRMGRVSVRAVKIWARQFAEDIREARRKFARRQVRKFVELVLNDLDMKALIEPSDSSVIFENEKLRDAPRCKTRDRLYRLALDHVASDAGLFLEFGV